MRICRAIADDYRPLARKMSRNHGLLLKKDELVAKFRQVTLSG